MNNPHFLRSEFKCFCCDFDVVDAELLQVLTDVREHFNKPVIINSACRCEAHNKIVGGSSKSQHLLGKASDIVVKGVHSWEVGNYLRVKYPNKYGIGEYDTFTHIDVRKDKARW